jgi:hypothetical protein
VIGDKTISGNWKGIDDHGRALLEQNGKTTAVSAGDFILS